MTLDKRPGHPLPPVGGAGAVKPILVLQQQHDDGPAFLATWLRSRGLPFELFNIQAGQHFPPTIAPYSALAILGGEMGANDTLPSLRQAEHLILEAMLQQRPVIGHCLGGQLMARALGGRVQRAPQEEIGWHAVMPTLAGVAWFDDLAPHTVFQWHRDCFELPPGSESLATSALGIHQAFAVGPHLALQFHVELDEPKLREWVTQMETIEARAPTPWVQAPSEMLVRGRTALPAQQRLAQRLYQRWLAGVSVGADL